MFEEPVNGAAIPTTPANGTFTVQATTAADVTISGRVLTSDGSGLRNARVALTDMGGNVHTVLTSAFGYYTFENVPSGAAYVLGVQSRRYTYRPRVITVSDSIANFDFSPE